MFEFQVPYFLMLFSAGLPVFFLEILLGQYAGVGPVKTFGRLVPLLRGLGYVSMVCRISFWKAQRLSIDSIIGSRRIVKKNPHKTQLPPGRG